MIVSASIPTWPDRGTASSRRSTKRRGWTRAMSSIAASGASRRSSRAKSGPSSASQHRAQPGRRFRVVRAGVVFEAGRVRVEQGRHRGGLVAVMWPQCRIKTPVGRMFCGAASCPLSSAMNMAKRGGLSGAPWFSDLLENRVVPACRMRADLGGPVAPGAGLLPFLALDAPRARRSRRSPCISASGCRSIFREGSGSRRQQHSASIGACSAS